MIYYVSSKRKKQKGCLCPQWNWNAFSKSNYKQKHAFFHIIQKAVFNNLSEEKTEHLTCDRWNYSHPSPFLHDPPNPTSPLHDPPPPLHDPPHQCMTHPTQPHPCMTHPYPYMTHPTLPLHDPPHPRNIFGKNIPGFYGLLHYVSLSVDNQWRIQGVAPPAHSLRVPILSLWETAMLGVGALSMGNPGSATVNYTRTFLHLI